ncbi:MAG: cation:proton antiporter, partial [Desulfurococcaceae archaeon]
MIKEIAVFILVFSVYIIYTGSFTAYDMFTGILISIFISMYSARFLVSNERKLMDPRRAFTLI